METIYNAVNAGLEWIIEYSILLVEFIGVGILLYAVGRALYELIRGRRHVRLHLAEGIALCLEFKMGGELLRTSLVRSWQELLTLGAIIVLRAAITFLIQWEIRNEKKEQKEITAEETTAVAIEKASPADSAENEEDRSSVE